MREIKRVFCGVCTQPSAVVYDMQDDEKPGPWLVWFSPWLGSPATEQRYRSKRAAVQAASSRLRGSHFAER